MNEKKSESWAAEWDDPRQGKAYGDVFYQRAVGDLPEMECSKAAAKKIVNIARPGDRIVDVGCGSGHYLRSLLDQIETPFAYHGIDRTQYFVDLAQRAFGNCKSASFGIGDIFKLAEADQSADIVMCNNVLLHLPSIAGPLSRAYPHRAAGGTSPHTGRADVLLHSRHWCAARRQRLRR